MTVRFREDVAAALPVKPARGSALVRRLLFRSHDDAAKRRILKWFLAIADVRLLEFGLTREDIVILRTTARRQED